VLTILQNHHSPDHYNINAETKHFKPNKYIPSLKFNTIGFQKKSGTEIISHSILRQIYLNFNPIVRFNIVGFLVTSDT